jgi:hypothetical protein
VLSYLIFFCTSDFFPCPFKSSVFCFVVLFICLFADHILQISNAAAKFDESPLKQAIDAVITEFTGRTDSEPEPEPEQQKPRQSASILNLRRKKSRPQQSPEQGSPLPSSRTRRLAQKLAEERRLLATQQKAEEKLAVWRKLSELDMTIARGSGNTSEKPISSFEQMLMDLQSDSKRHRPSCFMNLACFLNIDNPDKMAASVIQPTCAFSNEGSILGIWGPPNADAANLLASLQGGGESTNSTEITVKDTLKLSEFLKQREKQDGSTTNLDSSVEILMGKMMLTSCSGEIIGTLIQRGNTPVAANTQIEIGDKVSC